MSGKTAKRGAFQRGMAGLTIILERRLALLCWMECEVQRTRQQIMEDKEQLLEQPLLELRSCPKCLRFAPLSHTQVDTRKNRIVHIYECQCGEQFSDGWRRTRT
jgi:hypothetical protein